MGAKRKGESAKQQEEQRMEWRDNLLTKYEEKIRNLEKLLRLASYTAPNDLKLSIAEELNRKV